jgi:hypothetical protein
VKARAQHFCLPVSLRGLLEPDAVKVASPVLRGAGRSNALGLPDINYRAKDVSGLDLARSAVDAWEKSLKAWGLL